MQGVFSWHVHQMGPPVNLFVGPHPGGAAGGAEGAGLWGTHETWGRIANQSWSGAASWCVACRRTPGMGVWLGGG